MNRGFLSQPSTPARDRLATGSRFIGVHPSSSEFIGAQLSTGFSHRFPLEQTAAAIDLAARPTETSLKF